jgi:hypothetical protein
MPLFFLIGQEYNLSSGKSRKNNQSSVESCPGGNAREAHRVIVQGQRTLVSKDSRAGELLDLGQRKGVMFFAVERRLSLQSAAPGL